MVLRDTVRETRANNERMESCPRFDECDAPKCPLDENMHFRVFIPGDARCTARKGVRYRLGGTSLETLGLTRKEYASTLNWHGSREAAIDALNQKYGKGVVS